MTLAQEIAVRFSEDNASKIEFHIDLELLREVWAAQAEEAVTFALPIIAKRLRQAGKDAQATSGVMGTLDLFIKEAGLEEVSATPFSNDGSSS
jgi:hypothetical protein